MDNKSKYEINILSTILTIIAFLILCVLGFGLFVTSDDYIICDKVADSCTHYFKDYKTMSDATRSFKLSDVSSYYIKSEFGSFSRNGNVKDLCNPHLVLKNGKDIKLDSGFRYEAKKGFCEQEFNLYYNKILLGDGQKVQYGSFLDRNIDLLKGMLFFFILMCFVAKNAVKRKPEDVSENSKN